MQSERQGGYVLLLTLLFLMLMAFSIMGLARKSLQSALQAKEAAEDLQRRWGVTSLRHALAQSLPASLDRAFGEYVLQVTESENSSSGGLAKHGPPREMDVQLTLGGTRFDVRFADEEAKLSVNALSGEWPEEEVLRAVEELSRERGTYLSVRLTPHRDETLKLMGVPFTHWEQVFDQPTPETLYGSGGAARAFTLWGSGKLRLQLASDRALEALLGSFLKPEKLQRLLLFRSEHPGVLRHQASERLALSPEERRALHRLLTDRSTAHSLWIVVKGARRKWYQLFVQSQGQGGMGEIGFTW